MSSPAVWWISRLSSSKSGSTPLLTPALRTTERGNRLAEVLRRRAWNWRAPSWLLVEHTTEEAMRGRAREVVERHAIAAIVVLKGEARQQSARVHRLAILCIGHNTRLCSTLVTGIFPKSPLYPNPPPSPIGLRLRSSYCYFTDIVDGDGIGPSVTSAANFRYFEK